MNNYNYYAVFIELFSEYDRDKSCALSTSAKWQLERKPAVLWAL